MTLQILIIGFLVSLGQIPASEPGLTAERIAECDATVKQVTQKIISGGSLGGLERDMNTCRAALRAEAVIRALASRRTPHHIEATRLRTGTAAARDVVDAFNREGLRARFDSSDLDVLPAFGIALAAEACLGRDSAVKVSVEARQVLEAFNRLGADGVDPYGTPKGLEECLERKK